MTDKSRIEEIKARLGNMRCVLGNAHWEWRPSLAYPHIDSQFDGLFAYADDHSACVNILSAPSQDVEINPEDATFIAHAPADIRYLLATIHNQGVSLEAYRAEVERLTAENATLKAWNDSLDAELVQLKARIVKLEGGNS